MDSLTENERKLWSQFKDGKAQVQLDDLVKIFDGPSRHSLNLRIKYLAAKMAPEGWVIRRVSGIGRGAKGVYEAEKKF